MKMGFYPKLAVTGISKNRRIYIPYILTCIGMVMMYYILAFLSENESVRLIEGGESVQMILSLGCWVMGVFALIFLFYTNSFLMRRRKKEFGLYNILGMGKWNLTRILLWESLITAVVSLAAGLFCGVLFSKAAELLMIRLLGAPVNFPFSFDGGVLLQTTLIFLVIFALILLNALRQIHLTKPIELLHSETVGEKPPKVSWFWAVLGVVLLAGAYYLAVSIQEPISAMLWFFVAVIMVIVATYLLFITGSVALCKLLQKNKRYYYKTNHFVSVSSMAYRMKRNGAGLASICILSTMVLVMISSTACLYLGLEGSLRERYPRDMIVDAYSLNEERTQSVYDKIVEVLGRHQQQPEDLLAYRYLEFAGYFQEDQVILDSENLSVAQRTNYDRVGQIVVIPLEDYNRIMGQDKTLSENEVLLFTAGLDYTYPTITLEGHAPFTVHEKIAEFIPGATEMVTTSSMLGIVVPDDAAMQAIYEAQAEIYGENQSFICDYFAFNLRCDNETQIAIVRELSDEIWELPRDEYSPYSQEIQSLANDRMGFIILYAGLFFLGVLLGIVFILGAVLIMYYKQITEGYEDQSRFEILQKVGMTKKEIKKSINSQVLTVFFLPLLLAGVHVAFAFPLIRKLLQLFGLTNGTLLLFVTIGCYLVFALFYIFVYLVTSKVYYRIVSGRESE